MTYLLDPCTDPNLTSRPSNCLATPVAPACSTANMTSGSPLYPSYQCGIAYSFGYKNITNYTIGARETDVGFYAEDDWKVKPNLTFSYGIRMEAQNAINSSHDFAPRLAIAYGVPRKNGKTTTVIRGGFGVFFNRFGLGSIEGQIANNGVNAENYTFTNPATTCQPTYNSTTGEFTSYDPSLQSGNRGSRQGLAHTSRPQAAQPLYRRDGGDGGAAGGQVCQRDGDVPECARLSPVHDAHSSGWLHGGLHNNCEQCEPA